MSTWEGTTKNVAIRTGPNSRYTFSQQSGYRIEIRFEVILVGTGCGDVNMSTNNDSIFSLDELSSKIARLASLSNDMTRFVNCLESGQITTQSLEAVKKLIEQNNKIKEAVGVAREIAECGTKFNNEELECQKRKFENLYEQLTKKPSQKSLPVRSYIKKEDALLNQETKNPKQKKMGPLKSHEM